MKRQMSRQDLCHGRERGLHSVDNGELLKVLVRGLDGEVYVSEIHSSSHAEKGGLELDSLVRRLVINLDKFS